MTYRDLLESTQHNLGLSKRIRADFSEEDHLDDINDDIADDLMSVEDFHKTLKDELGKTINHNSTSKAITSLTIDRSLKSDEFNSVIDIFASSTDKNFEITENEVRVNIGISCTVGFARRIAWNLDSKSWREFDTVFSDATPGSMRFYFKTTKRMLYQVLRLFRWFYENQDEIFNGILGKIEEENPENVTNTIINLKPINIRTYLKPVLHDIIQKELTE